MASDIFTRAKAYRKKHPRTAWQDCVKAVAGKKRSAVGKVKKKSAKTVIRKAKTVIVAGTRKKKHHSGTRTIGSVSLDAIKTQHTRLAALVAMLHRHMQLVKEKGLMAAEKSHIRREIVKIKHAIASTKKHIQSLKKSI